MAFKTFKLTDAEIRGVANIIKHEQGTNEGRFAEASLIANRAEIHNASIKSTCTGGWFAHGKVRFSVGTNDAKCIQIVKKVLVDGKRTLPGYVDEHDYIGDIATVTNDGVSVKSDKSKWESHKTKIHNNMGSTYTFYSFPGGYKSGVDPFGYTSESNRSKYGEYHFDVDGVAKETSSTTGSDSTDSTISGSPYTSSYKRIDGVAREFAFVDSSYKASTKSSGIRLSL